MTNLDTIAGTHNFSLVFLSIGIAIVAAYTALDLATYVKATAGKWRVVLWLTGGALALGIGIWSMHFIGMLAYGLPVPVNYNFPIVGVSMVPAILAAGVALFLVIREELSWLQLVAGGIFMGLGIAAMHYTGMHAMQLKATPLYDLRRVGVSLVVAIGASLAALWLTIQNQSETIPQRTTRKFASAIVMGIAIAGMHYTAMAAVTFQLANDSNAALTQIDNSTLAVSIGIATLILLALAIIAATIAQRLAAENARTEVLRQSEARFRALEQNSSDVIQVIDAAGSITYTSSSMQRILGYTPEDWQGKQAVALVYQDDLALAQKLLQDALAHPAANIFAELRLKNVNGARNFEAIACNLLAEPNVNGIVITYRDISKRKQTESALWNALQRLTFHVENSPLAVIEWNRDFRVARWSRAAETLFGWQAAEVLGKLPSEWNFIFPDDRTAVGQVIERLIDGSQQRNVSFNRNYTKDGNVVYCEWYNSGLLDEVGNLVSVLSLVLDVTQQKRTEAELVQRANELVRLTTLLAQTNCDLQKRNQELDEFTYVVSHDLKAPLRAIANLSEWIEEDLEDLLTTETRRQMNLLRQRVYRLEALINGLLEYSRIGRIETAVTSVSVATLLAEVIASLAVPVGFTIEVAPCMPTLLTHRLPLEQVFSNLISNAIKHHPRSNGKIQITAAERGDFYEFIVADDGDGIAPEYHAKAFGIFQTLGARDRQENTGIGLAIVKKIVENQGGKIWVESQAGQGATFHFTWAKIKE
ncbi:MHYT domain-containing protein [Chroococcidiopsis sp. TS-821]|uniref:MHYT domain-containing protein n=1 Tax=Chroococcidiopsis sp. TS-821 TaxID=1378066 RepID=UPI000CEDB80F|nr:MHYT domain-containing protein [Chroococcidiopsis sp. TS-821]PPS45346.1 hypothetical protein B1A85_03585 [Chroococcidiopsis sp. TS-821]